MQKRSFSLFRLEKMKFHDFAPPLPKFLALHVKIYFPMPMYTIRLINHGQLVNYTALIRFDQRLK